MMDLRIALGISIATGRMRKEVARELFIFLGIYEDRLIQRLYNPLADWIIQDSRNYTGRVILKQLAGWWIWEGLDRCTIISQFFTESEQILILTFLQKQQRKLK
jgi:hypothetical protein